MNRGSTILDRGFLAVWILACTPAFAATSTSSTAGSRFPAELKHWTDAVTGVRLTALTTSTARDDKIYQTHRSWTADAGHVIFFSDRTGRNEIFARSERTGEIIQLTDAEDCHYIDMHHRRNVLLLLKGRRIVSLDVDGAIEKRGANAEHAIARLPDEYEGLLGGSVDADDRRLYLGAARRGDKRTALLRLDLETGRLSPILTVDFRIGHVQANPLLPGIILYCKETGGDADQRTWIVNADGTGNRPFYRETYDEWVTHELWWGPDRVLFTIWPRNEAMRRKPHGAVSISRKDGAVVIHNQHPYWHVAGSPDGKYAVADTFAGELWLINIQKGKRKLLTQGHRPAESKPHPHPSFSPDGKRILFCSGRWGNPDLVTVEVPAWDSLPGEGQ